MVKDEDEDFKGLTGDDPGVGLSSLSLAVAVWVIKLIMIVSSYPCKVN